MAWLRVDTVALDIDSGIDPQRALAITQALSEHAVPLLAARNGRLEPLGSAALYLYGETLVLVTCQHLFEAGVALGDLALPLADSGRVLWLRHAAPRLLVHPSRDLAAIAISATRAVRLLRQHWRVLPLPTRVNAPIERPPIVVLVGYPYAQMRRVDAVVLARPVVVFARTLAAGPDLKATYARVARRIDGADVHAPALDGVSGATLWAVSDAMNDTMNDGTEPKQIVLQPAAVQIAFKHDAYVRAEPLHALIDLLPRLH